MNDFDWPAVKQEKLLFIAGDAGGANVLSGIIKHHQLKGDCLLDQPARNIFKSQGIINDLVLEKDVNFKNYGMVFSSTGKMDGFEIRMMNYALVSNVKVIAILDHWVNYKSRFLFESKFLQPSVLMVTDTESLLRARELFEETRLYLEPNYYLQNQVAQAQTKTQLEVDFLILDERCESMQEITFPNLLYYPRLVSTLRNSNSQSIICVRAHPSRDNYELRYLEKLGIEVSTKKSLGEDISRSRIILGLSSMSFYIAYLSGKRVVSFDPMVTKKHLPILSVETSELSHWETFLDKSRSHHFDTL